MNESRAKQDDDKIDDMPEFPDDFFLKSIENEYEVPQKLLDTVIALDSICTIICKCALIKI